MKNRKIFVIDDDEDFIKSIIFSFKHENYKIITSLNAKDALNILKNDNEIQVILIDLKIPNFTGNDFLNEIKEYSRPLKRIVITAEEDLLSEKEAEDLKIFSYLTKPFGSHSLLFTIKSAFNELELEDAKQWKDLALITTDTVHLIGNKISPIRRRIHEIFNTINTLYTEKIIDQITYDKLNGDIQIIKDSAEQTFEIKSDLIDKNIDKYKINIIPILEKTISNFKREYKNLNFQLIITDGNHTIIGDKLFLSRVFNNIIINSIHSIEDKILLNKEKTDGIVSIDCYLNNNHIVIDFKDNGMGIEDRDISKIFLPFFTTKGADRGNGIGLYFCKRTIEDFGGKILIKDNILGEGITFSIELPCV